MPDISTVIEIMAKNERENKELFFNYVNIIISKLMEYFYEVFDDRKIIDDKYITLEVLQVEDINPILSKLDQDIIDILIKETIEKLSEKSLEEISRLPYKYLCPEIAIVTTEKNSIRLKDIELLVTYTFHYKDKIKTLSQQASLFTLTSSPKEYTYLTRINPIWIATRLANEIKQLKTSKDNCDDKTFYNMFIKQ